MPIHKLKLVARQAVAQNTILLTFEKPDGFQFVAGQYGGFTLINPSQTDAGGITRRFSLMSTPDEDTLQIVTRIQASAYKKELSQLSLGSEIKFAGPSGNFVMHSEENIPAVMIAGGIGIAPFLSIIRDSLKHQPKRHITLFYGNNTRADSPFIDALDDLAKTSPQLKVIHAMASPSADWQGETGYITDSIIKKYVPDLSTPIFYICGSPSMVNALHETLKDLEIDESKIRIEDFPGY